MIVRVWRNRWFSARQRQFFLFMLCSLVPVSVVSMSGLTDATAGGIALSDAQLRQSGNSWLLEAQADIDLSPEIRAGLDNGVPLNFIVDLTLSEPRRWWPDQEVFEFQQRFSLIYYELTRHYRLQDLNGKEIRNFRSLLAAVEALGTLRGITIPGEFAVSENAIARLSMRLDSSSLPLPLQPLLSRKWRLRSREYVWPVN